MSGGRATAISSRRQTQQVMQRYALNELDIFKGGMSGRRARAISSRFSAWLFLLLLTNPHFLPFDVQLFSMIVCIAIG